MTMASQRAVLPFLLGAVLANAQSHDLPKRAVTDPGVVTTRQSITPAGVQSVFPTRVYAVDFAADPGEVWVLGAGYATRLDWLHNQVLERIPVEGTPGLQGLRFSGATKSPWISRAARPTRDDATPRSQLVTVRNGKAEVVADRLGAFNAGALVVASKPDAQGRLKALVPLIRDNRLAILDTRDGKQLGSLQTGIAPFAVVTDEDAGVAYVSNWGGRMPNAGDLTAPAGLAAEADRVVIDKRGIASTGTVTKFDLKTMQPGKIVLTGLHPTALAWDLKRARLYVANANSDSITVVNTSTDAVVQTVRLRPFAKDAAGIAPTALALSPDGATLYAACGGINAVAVLDAGTGALRGMIPTGWYPSSLSVSGDGKHIAIGTLLGAGSGWRDAPAKRFVHSYRGSVHVVAVPDDATLRAYTVAVAENTRLPLAGTVLETAKPRRNVKPKAVPDNFGDPSLIEHVVYIIKENRTYDQVFGAMKKGNGDASLVMFGEDVTPNHHRLADQFVVLDNFYATGGNSGDGHQWVTQANETAYALWPGYQGRSYPFDGSDPIAYASSGFIWEAAAKRNRSVKVYGEFVPRMSVPQAERKRLLAEWKSGADFSRTWTVKSPIPSLQSVLVPHFPSYTNAIPDVVRADIFLKDLKEYERQGKFPNLVLLQLPSDHTYGTSPGVSTPKAMVADNDLALGRVVEGLSKSPFWKKMAIFVVEDDAQNGVDHVDGHRTVALAISPYIRRGSVDSTFYAHQSMLKTIELILGLQPMAIFDLIANDMRASFHDTPDFTPYAAVTPKQDLFDLNAPVQSLRGAARDAAVASSRMRWDVPDAVPSDRLNRILWHDARGWSVKYPGVKQAVFTPMAIQTEDDERE